MGIVAFCKKGKVKYRDVAIGGKGECVNFGLLGRCLEECTFQRVAMTVLDERQHDVKKALTQGLATLASKAPKASPA